jgi:hypothetical protein
VENITSQEYASALREGEEELLRADRHRRLVLLGYDAPDVDWLTDEGVDVSQIEQLVKKMEQAGYKRRGALGLAVRIVL